MIRKYNRISLVVGIPGLLVLAALNDLANEDVPA